VTRRSRPLGALFFVVAAAMVVNLGSAPAFAETDYPSWHDVLRAKKNEAAKKAEIVTINGLIDGLQNEAAAFAKTALQKGEEYNQALDAFNVAQATAVSLQSQADTANLAAQKSGAQAGELIAQLSRMGGSDFSMQLFLSGSGADDLLYKMGAMDKLTEHASHIYEQATQDANAARSLSGRANSAEKAREDASAIAKRALAEAHRAASAAEARAKHQQQVYATLYAQLGSLKGTTAATEKAYLKGVAWEKAQNAIKHPPAPPPPANPPPPPPNSNAVSGAIAFAKSQVGDPYVFAGYGPNAWDCSGLTKASYASVGVYIGSHSSNNQWATMAAEKRLVPINDLAAGDLLFYSSGGSKNASKYHVTLYIGNGLMVEAPYPGVKVRITSVRYGDLVPYSGRPTP
jgi:peptidoglycan DL-endopeptidase CwlO